MSFIKSLVLTFLLMSLFTSAQAFNVNLQKSRSVNKKKLIKNKLKNRRINVNGINTCNNGKVDPWEECDNSDLSFKNRGGNSATYICNNNCKWPAPVRDLERYCRNTYGSIGQTFLHKEERRNRYTRRLQPHYYCVSV